MLPLPKQELPAAQRILFLGDSITHGGGYVAYIDTALTISRPDLHKEILSCGLSSETVSGLSEPGHAGGQFPRPSVHERLDRVLAQMKPDLVVACYGMNDGIYMPLSEDRFAAFRQGMTLLHDKVIASGAKIVHMTPPVFDNVPIQARTDPTGKDATKQYAGYDEVLAKYAAWLVEKRDYDGWAVIDLHYVMDQVIKGVRPSDPAFTFSNDGVHPNDAGHRLMAQNVLDAWAMHTIAGKEDIHPKAVEIHKLIAAKQALLRDAWLTTTGHKRPGVKDGLPLPEAQAKAAELDAQARALVKIP